jgi:hypothetical protein
VDALNKQKYFRIIITLLTVLIVLSWISIRIQQKGTFLENRIFNQTNNFSNNFQLQMPIYSQDQNDTDNDGMPDDWEIENGLDPDRADGTLDYDFDELVNVDEYLYNTDPYNPDTDGDHFNDGVEVQKGTDPTDPDDHPVRIWLIILIVLASGLVLAGLGWLINIMIKVKKGELGVENNN